MPDGRPAALDIAITKRADGVVVLRCTRADGSATWQRQTGRQALFFPFHDLTHLAVESTLGFRRGFYGLIAEGWELDDTTGKGARGPLPEETVLVEHLVGLFDRERAGGATACTAAEFNAHVAMMARTGRVAGAAALTDAQLDAVRRRIDELHGMWAGLPDGGTLALRFDPRDAR